MFHLGLLLLITGGDPLTRLLDAGRWAEAEQEARALITRLGPGTAAHAIATHNLATSISAQGRLEEAEPLLRDALARGQRTLPANSPDLAAMFNGLAVLLYNQHRYERAEPVYRQALVRMQTALGPRDPRVAACLHNLAVLYAALGENSRAERHFRAALAIWEPLGDRRSAESRNSLATVLARQGRVRSLR